MVALARAAPSTELRSRVPSMAAAFSPETSRAQRRAACAGIESTAPKPQPRLSRSTRSTACRVLASITASAAAAQTLSARRRATVESATAMLSVMLSARAAHIGPGGAAGGASSLQSTRVPEAFATQSMRTPEAFVTFCHLASSSLMNCANSPGVLVFCS